MLPLRRESPAVDTENSSACNRISFVAQQILPWRNYHIDMPSLWKFFLSDLRISRD